MLPGPTFVKTFLRTYAEALGLDPHLLVEEYRASYEAGDDVDHIQSLGPPNLARDRRRRAPRFGPGSLLLLVVVAVVGALVAIGLLADGGDDDGSDVAGETTPRQETTERRRQPERRRPTRVVLGITR